MINKSKCVVILKSGFLEGVCDNFVTAMLYMIESDLITATTLFALKDNCDVHSLEEYFGPSWKQNLLELAKNAKYKIKLFEETEDIYVREEDIWSES